MSKLTPESALMPPKESSMPSTASSMSRSGRSGSRLSMPAPRSARLAQGCRGGGVLSPGEDRGIGDRDGGAEPAGAAVLELDLGLDLAGAGVAVERLDEGRVFLGDEAPPDLAGAGQLAVIGVELLAQDEEAADLRAGQHRVARELAIDRLDMAADEVVNLGLGRELAIARIGEALPLGPVADGAEIDVDEDSGIVAAMAEGHRLADRGEELELVLEIFGREERAVGEAADILGAVDDLELAALVEIAGIAGMDPAVRRLRLARRLGVLVVLLEHAGAAEHHLARLAHLELDAGDRPPHGIGPHLAVRLDGDEDRGLGRAVELFDVDAERAVEHEGVRPDRLACVIGEADAAHPEGVLERPVDEELAEPIAQLLAEAHGLAVEEAGADAPRQRDEGVIEPALGGARILHADRHRREDALPDARGRKEIGGGDLAQILHHRRRGFRAAHAEAGAIGLADREHVVADPGHG